MVRFRQAVKTMEENHNLTDIELLAVNTVDNAFKRNHAYHKPHHDKQYRLYEFVRNLTPADKIVIEGRSNIQIGMAWMLHGIAFSILKNSISNHEDIVHIEPTKISKQLFGNDEMDEYLSNNFHDEATDQKSNADDSLWDLTACGSSVLSPSFNHKTKIVLQDIPETVQLPTGQTIETGGTVQQDVEIIEKSSPDFDTYNPWDVYPTANVSKEKNLHEVIFEKSMSAQQLRDWEKMGFIEGLDEFFELHERKTLESSEESSEDRERRQSSEDETERYGHFKIHIYWGLFPLYKYRQYIDDENKDRSADEVQSLIIKPKGYKYTFALKRNPFYHQLIPAIFSRYSRVPGEFWGVGFTEIAEQTLIHQQDWWNLMQDAANKEIYRDEVHPADGVEELDGAAGAGKRFYISAENLKNRIEPHYIERGPSILPEVYGQRDYLDNIIKQVTGIVDLVRGITEGPDKTATEVAEIASNINIRFKETSLFIESQLIRPMFNWSVSLLSQFSDDEYIMAYTGLPFNPFKQFDPMMPNLMYRVQLEGALRASQNIAQRQMLQLLIEISKDAEPMPDPDNDNQLTAINTTLMILDLIKISDAHRDSERYKVPITPEMMAAMAQQEDQDA